MLIPSQVHDIAEGLRESDTNLDSMQCIALSGDVINKDIMEKCKALFPSADVSPWFAMTEGVGYVGWPSVARSEHLPVLEGNLLGQGKVTPNCKVKVCDPENGQLLPRDSTGALHLCSPGLIRGYLEGRDAEAFYTDEDKNHWFVNGDAAVMDQAGVIYIVGRYKDIIKVAGVGLSPAIIEACLSRVAGVQVESISPHIISRSFC